MWKNIPIIKNIDFDGFYIRMNEVDYEGQKLAEWLYKIILTTFLVVSMIVSISTQKLSNGVFILLGGLVFSMLVCVPSWGFYNRNRLKWLIHKKEEETKKD